MKQWILFAMMVVCLVPVGCSSRRPPKPFQLLANEFVPPVKITKPADANSAAIGITIKSGKWIAGTENRLYLVRVDKEEDLYRGTKLVPTSLVTPTTGTGGGGTVYVQNVPPGRYVAVAYSESVRGYGKTRELTVYLFGKDMIKRTDTTVAAGGIGFMGAYELGQDTTILKDNAIDPAQEHYFEVLWGKPLVQVLEDIRNIGTPAYFPVHTVTAVKATREPAAESEFLAAAGREFDPAWKPIIERRYSSFK
ncbi:MAG TPA: hypothetical protein VJ805_13370 [Nitrospiraceae bacterium]|nr:hypothetical protein [Nitrospiraceae bacterium]